MIRVPSPLRASVLSGVTVALWAGLASSQDPPAPQPPEEANRLQFAVAVETVTLDVVVLDERGRFVPGLDVESFVILDEGVPQEITFFSDEFTPVTTTLLLDSSSSIRSSLSAIQTAAYLFAQNLSEGDTAKVALFSNNVRFGASFTRDLGEHYGLLKTMRPLGKTALYDAIVEGLADLSKVEGRKSLLLFTDGDDAGPANQGSQASLDDAIEAARSSEVTIYPIGFTGWGPDGSDSVNRPFLNTLAEATGGRAFFPTDIEAVQAAFAEVQEALHRHYRMAYSPSTSAGLDRAWRLIEVRVEGREDLTVRTRQGYYSTSDESP